MLHPEGLGQGCFGDQALDRCLFFDYNDIKYGADRLLLNQQILGQRTVPCPIRKPNEMDAGVDGFQFIAGGGVGLDAHIVVTNTKPVSSRANSTSSGFAALRLNQVALIS